jgi:uncharacterized membrane protein YccC
LPGRFRDTVILAAAELARVGYVVQSGAIVRDDIALDLKLHELEIALKQELAVVKDPSVLGSIRGLEGTLVNLRRISKLLQRLVMYTRLEGDLPESYPSIVEANDVAVTQPITFQAFAENFTLKSNTFRHALRLTAAVSIGFSVSFFLPLSHVYWVLLTIVTILRPVYAVSRQRNIQRVGGTLVGALVGMAILYFVPGRISLLGIMIGSMVMSYSLFRVQYFSFVLFLTIYVIITFHFLNPSHFTTLIEERLLDTVIGSVIAAAAARFILPVWGTKEIRSYMRDMVRAHRSYFNSVWDILEGKSERTTNYKLARKDAVVALTNLSDNFQHVLSEPKHTPQSERLHQFVIANHLLTGHIAALSREKFAAELLSGPAFAHLRESIDNDLVAAESSLNGDNIANPVRPADTESGQAPNILTMIATLTREVRAISKAYAGN